MSASEKFLYLSVSLHFSCTSHISEGKENTANIERLLAVYSGGKRGVGFYFSVYAIARHLLEREARVGRRREDSGRFTQMHAICSIAFVNDRKVQSKLLEQTLANVQPY